ncbi:MAG TPA: glycosyltransferase family 4 protein [Methylomirabilota bacterium]|nr:glycosyltransferase family 4 protein [Methylomirabilota bacterium]
MTAPRRVLLVSPRCDPEPPSAEPIGGGPISVRLVAQALVDADVDVRVLSFVRGRPRSDERLDGVPVTRLPIRPLWPAAPLAWRDWLYREIARGLEGFVAEWPPDLLHAFGGRAVVGVAAVAERTGRPFVVTVNGPVLFCPTGVGRDRAGRDCLGCRGRQRWRGIMDWRGAGGAGTKMRAVLFWLYSHPHMARVARSLRRAARLLPVSHGLAHDLVRLGHPPSRVHVVHNPLRVPSRIPDDARAALGLPAGVRVLLYAGRLAEEKGVQNVLRVMPSLPDTVLVVIGQGRYGSALKRDAAALGVDARVRFLGELPNAALGPYYATADVVIMAGVFYEALGRMLMEACAHGAAVIGTRVGGIPDVIEDGRNGYLLETQDPAELRSRIRAILDPPARARQMGEYGRAKMAREFSPAACAAALASVYRSVCDPLPDGIAPARPTEGVR